jgi:hypothetical protein
MANKTAAFSITTPTSKGATKYQAPSSQKKTIPLSEIAALYRLIVPMII